MCPCSGSVANDLILASKWLDVIAQPLVKLLLSLGSIAACAHHTQQLLTEHHPIRHNEAPIQPQEGVACYGGGALVAIHERMC